MSASGRRSIEIRVPASTANLGAGFDCFGLALNLFLTVRAFILKGTGARSVVETTGVRGSDGLPSAPEENLIFRSMRMCAHREGFALPAARLVVHNAIPVASGLGSSAAAIAAGVVLAPRLAGRKISPQAALRYAAEVEGHADNVSAALLGGLVVSCVRQDGSVAAVRRPWPKAIRIVAVTPDFTLETSKARAALPVTVDRGDAVHNLQRSALLLAALAAGKYGLIWDALQDRLHQPYRAPLIPGLADILTIPRSAGLLGIALSGAGPTVIAPATGNFTRIGQKIAAHFKTSGIAAEIRFLRAVEKGALQ